MPSIGGSVIHPEGVLDSGAPVASIIICAFGSRAYTERCLTTLDDALGPQLGSTFELVLVDNASPDSTLELFSRWADRARVIALPENRNFAGGNNEGARQARGEVLVFLNNDTEIPVGALEKLVAAARDQEVGIVGPRLLYPDGRIQHGGVVFRGNETTALPLHLFHHEPGDLPIARATYELDATTGACLVVRAALFDQLGGFDETYINGLEDIDLCIRARLAGHRILYRGDVAIIHRERMTRGAGHSESRNISIFLDRWREVCGDDSDTLARVFGARFTPRTQPRGYPQELAEGATVALTGEFETIGTEAAEGRALLRLFDEAGLEPALRDSAPAFTTVQPPLDADTEARLDRARARPSRSDALRLHVPGGALWSRAVPSGLIRLACVPRRGPGGHDVLLVPSARLRDRLIEAGARSEQIELLRPPVVARPLGSGGAGVLALLPGHDLGEVDCILHAMRQLSVELTLMPDVRTLALDRLVADRLPQARVLGPELDETALGELAGQHDAVVAVCSPDGFERRALVAAASGTSVVTGRDGPVAEILGEDLAVSDGFVAEELSEALHAALEDQDGRERRAARVQSACGMQALAPQLAELVEQWRASGQISVSDLDTDGFGVNAELLAGPA